MCKSQKFTTVVKGFVDLNLKYKCTFSKCSPKQSNVCKFDSIFELKIHLDVRIEVDVILSFFVVEQTILLSPTR